MVFTKFPVMHDCCFFGIIASVHDMTDNPFTSFLTLLFQGQWMATLDPSDHLRNWL